MGCSISEFISQRYKKPVVTANNGCSNNTVWILNREKID